MKPRRLGRGLDFLLQGVPESEAESAAAAPSAQREIGIDEIAPNPWQPRVQFDEAGLAELSESIRAHGVLQPLVVREKPSGGFELIAGERRLLAAKRANLTRVPVAIRAIPDDQMLVVALIENIQRRDLNAVERARGFRRLIDEQHLSHERVAELAGMARSTISNSLRLLDLNEVQLAAVATGQISEGHARALLTETDPIRRQQLFEAIRDQRWNVRAAESAAVGKRPSRVPRSADAERLGARLREKLGAKVKIVEQGQRGRIVINYSSLKDFERLYELLVGEPPEIE